MIKEKFKDTNLKIKLLYFIQYINILMFIMGAVSFSHLEDSFFDFLVTCISFICIIFSTIVMFCISREKSSDLLKKSKILFVIISILTIGIIRQLNIKVHLFEKINESFLICSYISITLTIIVFYIISTEKSFT